MSERLNQGNVSMSSRIVIEDLPLLQELTTAESASVFGGAFLGGFSDDGGGSQQTGGQGGGYGVFDLLN